MTISLKISKLFNQKNVMGLCQYILAFLIILDCRSIFLNLEEIPGALSKVIILLIAFVITFMFFFKHKFNYKQFSEKSVILLFLVLYLGLYIIFKPVNTSSFIKRLFVFAFIFIYLNLIEGKKEFPDIFIKYKNIIFILAVISLFFWFFGSILGIISPLCISHTSWTESGNYEPINNYYYLFFETQTSSLGGIMEESSIRNTSIFTEAPMASFHFSLAFIIEQLYENKKSWIKSLLLVLAILSTFSTTGYCIVIIFFIIKLMEHKSKNMAHLFMKFLIVIISLVAGVIVLNVLLSAKLDSNSGSMRKDDIVVCLKTWCESPVFGVGFGNNDAIAANMDSWRRNKQGLANSIGQILAQGGVWIFILYIFSAVKSFILSFYFKDKKRFYFSALFLAMFAITIISYTYMAMSIFIWMSINTYLDIKDNKSLNELIAICKVKNVKTKINKA